MSATPHTPPVERSDDAPECIRLWRHVRPNQRGSWLYFDAGWQILNCDAAADYPMGAYYGPIEHVASASRYGEPVWHNEGVGPGRRD